MLFGGIGLVWVVLLVVFLQDTPPEGVVASKPSLKDGLLSMFAKPSAILMTLAFGLSNFGDIGFRTWMPTFLQRTFEGMNPATAAFHAVFWFYVGGFLGVLTGSRLSDKWKRHGNIGARLDCNLIGLVLCAPAVFFVVRSVSSLVLVAVVLAIYGFVHGFYDSNFVVSFYEVIVPRYRTSAYGLYACGAFVIGSFAPAVLGFLSGHFSLGTAFSALGGFYLLAAALTFAARFLFLKNDYEMEG